ncbi:MAG: hypothetical protein K0B00_08305 [Rhodobacteraceae bacterium]|nr:hypothetical protein [Paracoccaceae bacterium]
METNPLCMRGSASELPPEAVDKHLDAIYECACFLRNRMDALVLLRDDVAAMSWVDQDQKLRLSALLGVIEAVDDKFRELQGLVER